MKVFFFGLVSLLVVETGFSDWKNFRGPNSSGFAPGVADLPTELSSESIAWKVSLPGRGLGSAIIVGDKVFITAASGPDQKRLHIFCFAAKDGAPLWERQFWATGRTMTQSKTCVAAPTPATDGESIFALFSSNDLICLDLEGNLKWLRALTLDYPNASNSLGLASSPVVVGDALIAQIENDSESFAAGFDIGTGMNLWKMDRPKSTNWTTPTVLEIEGQKVVALQSSKGVLGVLPKTGSEVFKYGSGASTIPSSAAVGDKLYIPSNGLTVIKATTSGDEPKKLWSESAQRPGTASPLVIGEKVFVINNAGVLNCADIKTGERLWRTRLKGPFSGSPVATDNGNLYIFSETGVGQCVDITGEEGKVVSEVELGETILGTASLSNGGIYIRSDKTLWKLGGK